MQYKLDNEQFNEKAEFLKLNCQKIDVAKEDYTYARKLESKSGFGVGFYDCLHIAICKRLELVLISRDRLMLNLAKGESVKCGKPEEFL